MFKNGKLLKFFLNEHWNSKIYKLQYLLLILAIKQPYWNCLIGSIKNF